MLGLQSTDWATATWHLAPGTWHLAPGRWSRPGRYWPEGAVEGGGKGGIEDSGGERWKDLLIEGTICQPHFVLYLPQGKIHQFAIPHFK